MDLRLHDPDRPAEFLGGGFRLSGSKDRNAARHGHPKFAQNRLGLIFVDVHGDSPAEHAIHAAVAAARGSVNRLNENDPAWLSGGAEGENDFSRVREK